MSLGDAEPPHLPSLNALRCMKYKMNQRDVTHKVVTDALIIAKYTSPYKESIHDVGFDKFFVRYWTPSQLNCYREVSKRTNCPTLIIDATGGVVQKIHRPFNNKSGNIFLYQAVSITDQKETFPVCQFLSERHDNIAIQSWLEDWIRDGAPIPKLVICDRSKALLSGSVKAFTEFKGVASYNKRCYEILVEGKDFPPPSAFIRCDIAHLVKNVTMWKPMKVMSKGVKNFYVRSLVELLKAVSIVAVQKILSALFLLAESVTVGKLVENGIVTDIDTTVESARKLLKELISNVEFEIPITDCNVENSDDNETVNVNKERQPFGQWAEILLQQGRNKLRQEGEHDNAFYCPQIVPCILNLIDDLPVVSGIMCPEFGYGECTTSSAAVESCFKTIKNCLFVSDDLPIRADKFVTKHIQRLEGQLKLVASKSNRDTNANKSPTVAIQTPVIVTDINEVEARSYSDDNLVSSEPVTMKKNIISKGHKKIKTGTLEVKSSNTNVNETSAQNSETLCPECSKGNLPGGAHTCVKCRKPVHIIFEACSKAINSEEGYGEKRLCFSCYKSTNIEDVLRENWRGLGYSPPKKQRDNFPKKRVKSSLLLLEHKDKLKIRNIRNHKSYLIRQPDLANDALSRKIPKTVGVLKNGNRAQNIKPTKLKGYSHNVTLSNSCAFDSLSQIIACTYNDSKLFHSFVNSIKTSTITSKFLQFCKNLATVGVNATTYKKRVEIIVEIFPEKHNYPGQIVMINSECTASNIIKKIAKDFPSVKDELLCETCGFLQFIEESCLLVSVANNDLTKLNNYVNDLYGTEMIVCHSCSGQKRSQRSPCGKWIFIEPVDVVFETNAESDVVAEVEVKPMDLPLTINLLETDYHLRGFIGFSGRRKSINDIGHYTAYVRRANQTWELYDDMVDGKINVNSGSPTPCQIIVYTI